MERVVLNMLAIPAALPPDDSIQRLRAQPSSDGVAFLAARRFCVMDKHLVHRFRRHGILQYWKKIGPVPSQ